MHSKLQRQVVVCVGELQLGRGVGPQGGKRWQHTAVSFSGRNITEPALCFRPLIFKLFPKSTVHGSHNNVYHYLCLLSYHVL